MASVAVWPPRPMMMRCSLQSKNSQDKHSPSHLVLPLSTTAVPVTVASKVRNLDSTGVRFKFLLLVLVVVGCNRDSARGRVPTFKSPEVAVLPAAWQDFRTCKAGRVRCQVS
jgi:hypothetical protein